MEGLPASHPRPPPHRAQSTVCSRAALDFGLQVRKVALSKRLKSGLGAAIRAAWPPNHTQAPIDEFKGGLTGSVAVYLTCTTLPTPKNPLKSRRRGDMRPPSSARIGGETCHPDMTKPTPLSRDELVALLPRVLAEMAEVIPATDVLKLAERFGGTRLYFPWQPPGETSELARVLGVSAAQALSARYSGDVIEMPLAALAFQTMRDREIDALGAKGESAGQLARRFKLTRRSVTRILSTARRRRAAERARQKRG